MAFTNQWVQDTLLEAKTARQLELYKCSKDLISKDTKEIEDKASEKLDHTKAEKLKKIQEEESKSLNLTTRSKELQESQTRLTEGNTEFDEMLIE